MAAPLPPLTEAASTTLGRVARLAERERLFRHTQSVLVAVSGGTDSVACLLMHLHLRERFGFVVMAAHFDHQLRSESRADLQWVRSLCERLDVPCLTGEGDVGRAAREGRRGIEETARLMRYQFLGFVAGEKRADCVATGHTADDQAETVLLRVARGTGVRGLRGMLPAASLPGSPGQRLVRPLLGSTREETQHFCEAANITPLTDPTNADLAAARNLVRHRVLPALRELNPGVRESLLALAKHAREAFAETERRAHLAQPRSRTPAGAVFEIGALADLPAEALTLVIEREATYFNAEVEVNRTRLANYQKVLATGSGEVLFGEMAVEASCGLVRLGRQEATDAIPTKILSVPGVTAVGRWRVEVSTAPLPAAPGAHTTAIGAGRVKGVLRARPPAAGDRLVYRGMERKLSDAFASARVPRWERRRALAVAAGEVVVAAFTPTTALSSDTGKGDDRLFLRVSHP
ncbi:MAG: tRNA lysidine(34) synthetase TilS [Dehalococcoidia bacterium]|nr:tRNA lysidine(34) synthetase TilS [Dehalococcoidia bacterium]